MDAKTFYDPKFDLNTLPAFPDLPARKQIVWLASYPKSGNTWMRLFMASYLSGASEVDINKDLHANYQCNNGHLAALIAKKPVEQFSKIDAARVRVGVQRIFARNPTQLFVKTHVAVAAPHGYPTFDPQSTAASVVVLRNPLAVLPSYARHMGITLDEAVEAMDNTLTTQGGGTSGSPATLMSSWSSFTRSWIAARPMLNATYVKYEEMKADPTKAFSSVLGHLRIAVDQARLQAAIEATDFEKLKAQDLKQGFKERTKADKGNVFFHSGTTDGWRQELEENHILATIKNHWDVMSQLDYIPEDYIPYYEDVKFTALEDMVARGVDIGVYASELNDLRAKRGIQKRLSVNSAKRSISLKERRKDKSKGRPVRKRTFG